MEYFCRFSMCCAIFARRGVSMSASSILSIILSPVLTILDLSGAAAYHSPAISGDRIETHIWAPQVGIIDPFLDPRPVSLIGGMISVGLYTFQGWR
jgi:hypothetical protein